MKNVKLLNTLLAISLLATMAFFASCDDEDEPAELTLSTLMAGSVDLNAATSPTDVPTSGAITATFSTDVDASTVTSDNITLVRDYDDASIPLTLSASGNQITITPDETLGSGTLYILTISGIKSTGGKSLTGNIERNFTTEGTFAPAGVIAHWTFEDNAEDQVGDFNPGGADDIVDITYAASRNEAAGKAASFNGTTSLIEIPGADALMENQDFAISFWVKASTDKNGQFVLGLAGFRGFQFEIGGEAWDAANKSVKLATQYGFENGNTGAEDTWWNGDGKTKDNGGWQGSTFNKDVSGAGGVGAIFGNQWTHVVCVYDATAKVGSMYVNGEKTREWDFNLWPDGDAKRTTTGVKYAGNPAPGNELAFGFFQARENRVITDTWADYSNPDNNHFKGLLDDVRIFSVPLTQTEVSLMYNSEKP